jgi:hypothetical protein
MVDDVPQVVVDSLPAALHDGLLAARLEPGLCLVQGAIGLLVAQGLLVKGGGREILVPARLWGHDCPFLVNNMSEEGLEKEKKEEKKEEKEENKEKEEEEEEEEKWLQNDETRTTEESGDPKALVEEGASSLFERGRVEVEGGADKLQCSVGKKLGRLQDSSVQVGRLCRRTSLRDRA